MLRMILGEAGTGKTTEVLRQIKEAAGRRQSVLLLVPEHASFEMERRVSALFTGEEQQYITLLSFPRLAEKIFRECGGLTQRPLDEVSRALLMREAISEVQERLTLYRRQAGYTGFISSMLQTVADFKRAGITPARLEEIAAETAGTALGQKLTDLQLIYEAFQALVELRFHDPLDELALALGRAAEKNWFAGRHIWVDSFDYFSVSERALLEQMLLSAESLTLSMTCPALDAGEDIFLYQKKFLLRMRAYAGAHALMCEEPLILTKDKRHQSPALAGLQRAFTRPETVPPAAGESLRLIEAPTVYEEMRFAAAEIARLVREEGLRYRDCVILCRDLDRYRNAKTVLEEYDLPYFCGEKQNILFAPLPFFLLTALEAASGSLKTAAILRLARSAASGLSPQQAGALENYSFIWNISGEDWLRPFTGNPEGMSDAAPEDYAAALAQVEASYDFILIDCPPSLELLTLNGLCACDSILIPVQCEYYALEGLSELISTLKTVRKKYNPYLDIEGVVFTMFSVRYNLTLQVVEQVKKYFGNKVYQTTIPRSIRISEAPSYGQPINFYEPKGKGSEAYMDLAIEFVKNNRPHEPAKRRGKGSSAPAEPKNALEEVKQGEV